MHSICRLLTFCLSELFIIRIQSVIMLQLLLHQLLVLYLIFNWPKQKYLLEMKLVNECNHRVKMGKCLTRLDCIWLFEWIVFDISYFLSKLLQIFISTKQQRLHVINALFKQFDSLVIRELKNCSWLDLCCNSAPISISYFFIQ